MKFFKSKTINFSMLLAIFGTLEQNFHLIKDNLGENYGIAFIVISIIVAGLRVVTTEALDAK